MYALLLGAGGRFSCGFGYRPSASFSGSTCEQVKVQEQTLPARTRACCLEEKVLKEEVHSCRVVPQNVGCHVGLHGLCKVRPQLLFQLRMLLVLNILIWDRRFGFPVSFGSVASPLTSRDGACTRPGHIVAEADELVQDLPGDHWRETTFLSLGVLCLLRDGQRPGAVVAPAALLVAAHAKLRPAPAQSLAGVPWQCGCHGRGQRERVERTSGCKFQGIN